MSWGDKMKTKLLIGVVAATAAFLPALAHADPVPPDVAAMIDAAAGDAATLKTVSDLAKKTNPNCVKEIDAQVAALTAKTEAARIDKISHEKLLEGIKGEGQIGFSNSSGNSHSTSLAAGLGLSKETLHWKNTIALAANYERDNGVTSQERFFAGYEGNYKFSPRFYGLGTLSWERDTFSGFTSRVNGSVGLGYKVVSTPKVTLALEAGPAVRYTDYIAVPAIPPIPPVEGDPGSPGVPGVPGIPAYSQTDFVGRVAGAFAWTIVPGTVFGENVSSFFGEGGTTLTSNTTLTTKLVGALSGRLGFLVQYQEDPPVGIENTDTTTQLTLVYSF